MVRGLFFLDKPQILTLHIQMTPKAKQLTLKEESEPYLGIRISKGLEGGLI